MLFNITFFSYTAKPAVAIEAESLLKAIYEYLKKPGANLYGANLYGANLYGADLRGANLRHAELHGADLRHAELRGANLHGANLHGADLRHAELHGADLRHAELHGANLHGAELRDADLRHAELRGANLYGADLHGANLYGAELRDADLRGASDMNYLKSLNFDTWEVGYTSEELQIGCQRHDISKWIKWNTPAGRKWIAAMDDGALAWADKYMALVLDIVRLAPAKANPPKEGA